MSSLGARIRTIRKQRNMTQAKVAGLMGISQAELSRMECGKTSITEKDIINLTAILGIKAVDLFTDQETFTVHDTTACPEKVVESAQADP